MGFLAVSAVFCLCVTSSLATYGPDHKSRGSGSHGFTPIIRGKVEEPRFHLDSPKIILNRPSFNVQGGGHGLEDESIYYGKSLHGVHSAPAVASAPYILDGGYSTGKVLDISAPIQVINHSPIVHERPILIRRPVVVSKGLTTTQDHLERLHYAHSGGYGGHGLGDYAAIPVSKGSIHERTIVYGGGLGHGYGHGVALGGHGDVSGYSSPIIVEQPKAYIGHADIGYSSGKALGGALHGGSYHGGALHGGSLYGGALHGGSYSGGSYSGGSLHGGALHGGSYSGDSLHGGALHGGSYNGGSYNGGSYNGGSLHGGSFHGAGSKKY